MGGRRFFASAGIGLAALLLAAPAAQASFHLIKVREVFPGTTAHPNADYVELQMYASGQYLVQFGELEVFNAAGTVTSNFTPGNSVANSANQSTILIANTEFSSEFPSVTPDFTDAGLNLSPAGGAVCWPQTDPPYDDCASWGSFSGKASLPSPGDSSPAAPSGIPNGMAILRTIEPGCPTWLENADDTNNSSVDFSAQSPTPRNNAAVPTERECNAPVATIDSKPSNPTNSTSASFTYHASEASSTFECKLDAAAFASCPASGIGYSGPLSEGSHTFEVRAHDANGTGAAASYTWRVDTTPPIATIDSHPADPSPGASASFTFHSSETGSTFECSLAKSVEPDAFSVCVSGKTYTSLADGVYAFKVRATDLAGNQGSPAIFEWTVDNSMADTTPPETTILSKPPDPSESPTASFTYESNEAGSSFECKLDGASFAGCPVAGTTYTCLAAGPHSFQVRAIDPSGNVDPTPAGYTFDVVGSSSPCPPPPPPPPPPLAPDTRILTRPPAKTRDRTPTFRFTSSVAGATFQCAVDRLPFRPCRSPFTTRSLSFGRHTVRIRAIAAGLIDETPAVSRFRVARVHRSGRRHG